MLEHLRDQYGAGAWWAAFVMRSEMKHLGGIVDETYLPILRLVHEDPDRVESAWESVKAQRNPVRRFDSPRTRWKKTYGNFVRELEWAYGELKSRMAERDFEDLVVYTMCGRMESWVGGMKKWLRRLDSRAPGGLGASMRSPSSEKMSARSMAMMAPIVGDIEIRGVEDGVTVCYIPDCAMHKVVSETEPQTNACLYGCKAACEAFMGPDDPMSIHFEPNLPAFDCIMRVRIGGGSAAPATLERDDERAAEPAIA